MPDRAMMEQAFDKEIAQQRETALAEGRLEDIHAHFCEKIAADPEGLFDEKWRLIATHFEEMLRHKFMVSLNVPEELRGTYPPKGATFDQIAQWSLPGEAPLDTYQRCADTLMANHWGMTRSMGSARDLIKG